MCTVVIARVYTSPVLELAQHVLDLVSAFVDGLVIRDLDVAVGRVPPHQAVLDHIDYTRDDPTVINPRNPMRQREIGLNSAHLRFAQQKQITHLWRLQKTSESAC